MKKKIPQMPLACSNITEILFSGFAIILRILNIFRMPLRRKRSQDALKAS